MSAASKAIFIVGAKRTPFGAFGGSLKGFTATDLAVHSSKAAIAHAKINPEAINETFMGNVISSSLDAAYLSRHVALKSGVPVPAPSLTINRLCGSGFETVCLGAEAILQVRMPLCFLCLTDLMPSFCLFESLLGPLVRSIVWRNGKYVPGTDVD